MLLHTKKGMFTDPQVLEAETGGGGTEARYNGHIKAHRNCDRSSIHCKDIDEKL